MKVYGLAAVGLRVVSLGLGTYTVDTAGPKVSIEDTFWTPGIFELLEALVNGPQEGLPCFPGLVFFPQTT